MGCHGDAKQARPWFAGTKHETRKCPRAHQRDNDDLGKLVALYRGCGGQPGIEGLSALSTVTLQGFAIIDDALNFKHREEAKELERKAKMDAEARKR